MYFECSQIYFTSMTAYEINVNLLFTSLVNSASVSNFNKFEISPQSDVVYGLFQCQGDLSYSDCRDCVVSSVSRLKETCPTSTSGTIQLEGCFIKYANISFFGVEDKTQVMKRCSPSTGYNPDILTRIDDALVYLNSGTGGYFRVGVYGSVQVMSQCVQDLSVSDCEDCVLEASRCMRSECETSTWGDMYLGKCYIRYGDGGFHPISGNIGIDNYKNDHNTRKKGKAIQAIGIIVAIFTVLSAVGVTMYVSITNVYKVKVKNEIEVFVAEKITQVVEKETEVVKKEAEVAKQEAKVAKKETKLAKEETEAQRTKAAMLSQERDYLYRNRRV